MLLLLAHHQGDLLEEAGLAPLRDGAGHPRRAPRGVEQPAEHLQGVVLPAPLGPRKPTRSPSAMEKEMPSTATTVSYERRKSERRARAHAWLAPVDAVVLGQLAGFDDVQGSARGRQCLM
jgi:hypothetical protein